MNLKNESSISKVKDMIQVNIINFNKISSIDNEK